MGASRPKRARYSSRDRERAAVLGLAIAQLPNAAQVRADWERAFGSPVPELPDALATLAELTATEERVSHRAFGLQLLTKAARTHGTRVLVEATDPLRDYAKATADEGARLARLRKARGTKAKSTAPRRPAGKQAAAPPPPGFEPPVRPAPAAPSPRMALRGKVSGGLLGAGPPRRVVPLPDDRDTGVRAVFEALTAAAETRPKEATAWQAFASRSHDKLQFSSAELALPQCIDHQHVSIGGHDSTRVATWFSTDRPAGDFARWSDPRHWALDSHLFYESVTPLKPIPDEIEEYSEQFTEVVRFSPTKTLETPLVFTRTVMAPDLYAVHFALPKGTMTADIAVDSGSLIAHHYPHLPRSHCTQITAEKCIAFRDPVMASWPTMSCDLFWTELAMSMALDNATAGT